MGEKDLLMLENSFVTDFLTINKFGLELRRCITTREVAFWDCLPRGKKPKWGIIKGLYNVSSSHRCWDSSDLGGPLQSYIPVTFSS